MRVLLITYDNDDYIHWFPTGMAYIAAILMRHGYDVEIYSQDMHHYSESHLQKYLDDNKYDVVGLSFIGGYYQYKKALKISESVNRSKNRPYFIIGGHGPTPEPEFFLKRTGANAVIMGEGEITIIELMEALKNKRSIHHIKGLAFRYNNQIIINERRPLIGDIDSIPFPAYHLFPIQYYRLLRMPHCRKSDFVMPLLSGRGCTFKCNFCYRMDEGFRPRSNEHIIEEIKMLKKEYGITYIAFADELLMSSKGRTISLCNDFIKQKIDIKWDCNGRLNFAKKDVLSLMKRAGCVFINYGIEAYDDQILKNMNKLLTVKQIKEGIEATLAADISPGFNIIFGNIGENRETLWKGVDFLLRYDDGAQMRTIRPVTPYPGSPLYKYAIEKGLLRDCEEFYEKKHINSDLLSVNFTDMSDDEFHRSLFEANSVLLKNYFNNLSKSYDFQMKKLYFEQDASFRGFRQT
ncbi:MAG: B12-binding domain-containing radical SAM protein [Desulfobaccales bacterium]